MEQWVNFPWQQTFLVSTLMIGGVSGLVLLINKSPSGRWLGALVITYLIGISIQETPLHFLLPAAVSLIVITCYLYIHAFFYQKTRTASVHFLIIVASFASNLFFDEIEWIYKPIGSLVILAYIGLIVRLLYRESRSRGFSYFLNPGSRVSWLRNFVIFNGVLIASFAMGIDQLVSAVLFLLLLAFILHQLLKESSFLSPIPIGNKYKKSTLTPSIKAAILDRLDEVMLEQKFYRRDDASLSRLARELGVTTHHLSQVLNESLKISFQDLIARFRVREACLLLRDEQHEQVKIENIATMVGYNSKSAFNTAFKRRTGLTPSEYRDAKDVRTYGEERLSERKAPLNGGRGFDLNHVFNLKMKSGMIQHFLKIFSRNVKRNGLFSFLNVLGLTVGFTCSILIYLFLEEELSYDQSIPDSDRIYRIAWNSDNPQTRTPHPMAQAMVKDFPEVEEAVSISPWYGPGLSKELVRVKNPQTNAMFEEPNFFFTDSTFFDVFQLNILEGDEEALSKPFSLVITETMAKKYFGDSSAVGRELRLNDMPIAVTAVVEPMPDNTHFHFNAIIPYITLKQINPNDSWMTWADFGHFNYLKLKPGADAKKLEAKIPDWIPTYLDWWNDRRETFEATGTGFILQPIQSIHLYSHLRWELENNGNILYVYILTGTLAFLILIVMINYINLTTAKSIERAKEVGVRKTLGAVSSNLTTQFYLESFLFCVVALVLSYGLSLLLMDSFNYLSGKSFEVSKLFEFHFLSKAILFCIAIGLLAGFYPAMTLSSFRPTEVLKGKLTTSSKGVRLRSVLVIFQFTISAILISGSLVIYRQIDFMKEKDLGFDKEAIISLSVPVSIEIGGIDLQAVRSVQEQIKRISGVKQTTLVSSAPGGQFNQHAYYSPKDPDNRVDASEVMVDYDFEKVLNLEVVAGRAYDRSHPSDSVFGFIINEVTAQLLNLENPVGKKLIWVGNDEELEGTIVGVVKDFHYRSLRENIQPLVMSLQPLGAGELLIKMEGNQFGQIINEIEPIYEQLGSELPFEYRFLDQELAALYEQEERTLSIFSVFSMVALILASLGLLGMAIAILNQRVKEVGMRKILGATSSQIMGMILGQFARLVAIAALIGLPLSYFMMQSWIAEFSYRAPFGVMPFVWSLTVLLGVAMLSVISAVTRITYSNPVDALRYE
ncbi:ABC transporter permease [Ekhidna sp.]|uniref:ABC transporter permease n=1 Tax=Ekhidna sp. TaxID=2608089 RepID=UPI003C7C4552